MNISDELKHVRQDIAQHPIRFVALLCVVAIGIFLGYLAVWYTNTLSSYDWCSKALQAQRISNQNFGGLTACVDLLKVQLQSLADNSKIVIGSFSFGLVVLVVIVIAGAKGQVNLPGGIGGNISPADAADEVAGAAVNKAADIKQDQGGAEPQGPRPQVP